VLESLRFKPVKFEWGVSRLLKNAVPHESS